MAVPPSPQDDAATRFQRVLDRMDSGNERFDRLRKAYPSLIKIFLIFCLASLSWYATYTGMLQLITANTGDVPFIQKIAIGFAVATLMLMVLYILDSLFSPMSWWLRILYLVGYVFLTLISVGFGFGFFWQVLESRAEATRSAEAAIGQVQQSLEKGKVRINQLGTTLDSLTTLSSEKAVQEREQGGTCPNSPPGDGPRRRLRDADAENFAFTSNFIKSRSGSIETDIAALNADLAKVLSRDPSTFNAATGNRNEFLRGLNRKLDLTITRFNALKSDPQLAEQRDRLAARSEQTSFPDGRGGTFACPDPQLQTALRGVVRAIDSLPVIEKTDVAAVEGSEAVVEAFRRLTTTMIGVLHFKLPPSPDELRDRQRQAIQSAENPQSASAAQPEESAGLGERDYIPLFVAIFVDFCLLLVSVNRPINRFQNLLHTVRDARDGPVGEILTRFHDRHQDGLAQEFEVFQHAVFDFLGDYYVAVPVDARSMEALYLTNLFVGLEGKGIIDRAMLPPTPVIRRKLRLQGSRFADASAFRLYRFRHGAWSKMVLDAILGTPVRAKADTAQATSEPPSPDMPSPNAPSPESGNGAARGNGHSLTERLSDMGSEPDPDDEPPALPGPTNGNGRRPPEV
ncbi:Yip1 family protein [Methyloligella sp. 2.7D]|uniref:Yip1 family protein n=1 Tax=unclassified Methyloligella TaxID=2625955 RepID=UPI00157C3004|nr:Yip1 family protein [Methyloligella sp. GL2]QKP78520.1 hypothetical protein HT051_14380 [Methyloligella sp. GL2]